MVEEDDNETSGQGAEEGVDFVVLDLGVESLEEEQDGGQKDEGFQDQKEGNNNVGEGG